MSIFALMRLFTIRFRMLSAIAVVLLLMGLIGGVGMSGMLRLQDLSGQFITHSFAQSGQLGQLRSALGAVRAHEKDMLLAQGQPEAVALAQTAWLAALEESKKALALLSTAPATGDIARQMGTRLDSYRSQFAEVAQQLQASTAKRRRRRHAGTGRSGHANAMAVCAGGVADDWRGGAADAAQHGVYLPSAARGAAHGTGHCRG